MPKLSSTHLTDTFLRTLKAPPERKDIYDAVTRGLGLRLAPSGTKTWFVMRRENGRMKRRTLGRYPDISLADARKKAVHTFEAISSGTVDQQKAVPTFGAVMETWLKRDQDGRQRRSAPEKRRAMNRDVLPVLGNKRMDTITKHDIQRLLDRVVDAGSPIHANRLLAYLRRMFNWAVEQDIIATSPANGIKKPADERSRDRTLTTAELGAVWKAANELEDPFGVNRH